MKLKINFSKKALNFCRNFTLCISIPFLYLGKIHAMRTFIIYAMVFGFSIHLGNAQILKKLEKAAKRGAERGVERTTQKKIEQKTTEATEEVLDTVLGNKKSKRNSGETASKNNTNTKTQIRNTERMNVDGSIIFRDDFNQTKTGDFPAQFTSSSGGSVVELPNGKGLQFHPNSNILLQTSSLPKNFALQFDLTLQNIPSSVYNTYFNVYFQQNKTLKHNNPKNKFGAVGFSLWGDKKEHQIDVFNYKTAYEIKEKIPFNVNDEIIDNTSEFTIYVNENRLQLYINGNKIADSPNLLEGAQVNYINFRLNGTKKEENHRFIISNVKVVAVEKDLRSQLMNGGFSTNDILFATASDQIQPSSFDILKQIGSVMQENPEVMFLIVGHTDSDGDDAKNQTLSEKRAASVRKYLLQHFKINVSNLRTMGKGEREPLASNTTSEGKAKNRRVEFIKE